MALVVLTSACGSPGVTTTALGLGLSWSRPAMVVEADPTGGSSIAAGYLRGQVAPPEGLIELALAAQDGRMEEVLRQVAMPLPGSTTELVAGGRSHEQARSLVGVWEPLSVLLRSLDTVGRDVIVDAGRLGLFGHPQALVDGADLALLVTRTDLVSLAGTRSWAETLRDRFERAGATGSLGVLLVGQGAPFSAREVAGVLGLPVVAALAWDPAQAAVLSHGAKPPAAGVLARLAGRTGWEDSTLLRSLRAAGSAITGTIRVNQDRLAASSVGRLL